MGKLELIILLVAVIVINIISISMKNYTFAIVFSTIYIAYALSSIFVSILMNRQKRARNYPVNDTIVRNEPRYKSTSAQKDPHPNDPRPNMVPVDTTLFPPRRSSIISNQEPVSLDARWSAGSYDDVGEPGGWDPLRQGVRDLDEFMASEKINGRSSFDTRLSLSDQVNSFFNKTRNYSPFNFAGDSSRPKDA